MDRRLPGHARHHRRVARGGRCRRGCRQGTAQPGRGLKTAQRYPERFQPVDNALHADGERRTPSTECGKLPEPRGSEQLLLQRRSADRDILHAAARFLLSVRLDTLSLLVVGLLVPGILCSPRFPPAHHHQSPARVHLQPFPGCHGPSGFSY